MVMVILLSLKIGIDNIKIELVLSIDIKDLELLEDIKNILKNWSN